MTTLSCLARKNGLVLVVDTCDFQLCTPGGQDSCPRDGRLQVLRPAMTDGLSVAVSQFNAQVVFDDRGVLVAKMRKAHLFGEM